eukprot:gene21165-23243_t
MRSIFNLATFNVRGLHQEFKRENLTVDLEKYKIDVCCLQEMKLHEGLDTNVKNNRLRCLPSESVHYGNRFFVSSKFVNHIHKYWKVSDRISVLQIRTKDPVYECHQINETSLKISLVKKYTCTRRGTKTVINHAAVRNLITIINVYAPTTERVKNDIDELDHLYTDLGILIPELTKAASLVLIASDFNAKIGKRSGIETCLGKYSRGKRNNSGQTLVDFCNIHDLFISNSAFQHPARHITTWEFSREVNNKVIHIYNQIDYIICPENRKHTLIDARSYSGTKVNSDHRMVICRLRIEPFKLFRKTKSRNKTPFNCTALIKDENVRIKYKNEIEKELQECKSNDWRTIKEIIKNSGQNHLGQFKKIGPNQRTHDQEIQELSEKQKQLRLNLSRCHDVTEYKAMKKERNKILHEIKQKLKQNKEQELNLKVSQLDQIDDASKMYKSVKMLQQKSFANPYVYDENKKCITKPSEIYKVVRGHFEKHFNDDEASSIQPYDGSRRKLNREISVEEVTESINKLNNNKTPGTDNISAEMVKYGPLILFETIREVLNDALEKETELELGDGILVSLQKPGKTKGPVTHLRPVILLPILRKILSNIVLR